MSSGVLLGYQPVHPKVPGSNQIIEPEHYHIIILCKLCDMQEHGYKSAKFYTLINMGLAIDTEKHYKINVYF